jgi:hypothetical protein
VKKTNSILGQQICEDRLLGCQGVVLGLFPTQNESHPNSSRNCNMLFMKSYHISRQQSMNLHCQDLFQGEGTAINLNFSPYYICFLELLLHHTSRPFSLCTASSVCCLLGLLFDSEDRCSTFLQNIHKHDVLSYKLVLFNKTFV